MFRVLFTHAESISASSVLENGIFPSGLIAELEATPEKTKKERVGAYALLSFAMEKYFGRRLSDCHIRRDRDGKPRLMWEGGEPSGIYFNISHSGGFAALAISDGGEVGIDIEVETDPARAERLASRMREYLPEENSFDFSAELEVEFVRIGGDGHGSALAADELEITFSSPDAPLPFESRWTILEAALKLDGGGFASVKSVGELYKTLDIRAKILKRGEKKIAISVAKSAKCK